MTIRAEYNRHQIAFAVLMGLIVFLLGSLFHALKERDASIAKLTAQNHTVVTKLTEIFEHTLAAETAATAAGQKPVANVQDVLNEIRGVDQAIIDAALAQAYRDIAAQQKATQGSTTSSTRPASTATTATTRAAITTTTARPTTTTTARATTTTKAPPTTTTTRPQQKVCSIAKVPLLNLCL